MERGSASQPQPLTGSAMPQPDYFFIKVGQKNKKLQWDEVQYLETGMNYVKLRLANSILEYPIRGTPTFVLEELLPPASPRPY
jgi:hypothetical protein